MESGVIFIWEIKIWSHMILSTHANACQYSGVTPLLPFLESALAMRSSKFQQTNIHSCKSQDSFLFIAVWLFCGLVIESVAHLGTVAAVPHSLEEIGNTLGKAETSLTIVSGQWAV